MKRITRIIRPIICMAVLLFAMTTAVMGCYQKETEPIDIPGRTPSGTSAPHTHITNRVMQQQKFSPASYNHAILFRQSML